MGKLVSYGGVKDPTSLFCTMRKLGAFLVNRLNDAEKYDSYELNLNYIKCGCTHRKIQELCYYNLDFQNWT